MSITLIGSSNINPLLNLAENGGAQDPIEIIVANKQPSPEQLADALLAKLGLTGDDLKAYNEAKSKELGKPFDVRQRYVEMFKAEQSNGQLNYSGLREIEKGPNKGKYVGYIGVNSEWHSEIKKFLADRRNGQSPTVDTATTLTTATVGGGSQSTKGQEMHQRGNEKREALNRMLQEKFKHINGTDTTVLGASAIATTRTAPALPAAAPWIGATILALPAIYTIKEILLNAAEKGVIQSPPSPITMDDSKPTDTVTPTTPDTTIPTDEELPKGDLTKTGPDTTSAPSTPTSPIGGPGKQPPKLDPKDITGPLIGAGTATIGKIITDKLGTKMPREVKGWPISPSMKPDPTREPQGTPERIPQNPKTPKEIERARALTLQNEAAETLSQAGYRVEQKPQLTNIDLMSNPWFRKTRKPDYKIEGEIFDCIAPEAGTSVRNIASRIHVKIESGQARRIVLNMGESTVTVDELKEELKKNPIQGLDQILVVKDGKVINLYPERY